MIIDVHSQLGKHPLFMFEQTLDEILEEMRKYGIEKTFLSSAPKMRFKEANDRVEQAVRNHPEKLVGFFNVNPVHPDALLEIDRAIGLGLKGLMLDPEFHFSMERPLTPGNPMLPPIFEKAVEKGFPILICIPNLRVGHSHDNALQQYNGLDELMSRFPEVRTIVDLFWPGIIELCKKHPNLYVDSAGASAGRISSLVAGLGATRLLFGSSSPRYHTGNHKQTVEWSKITPYQRKLILGGNAERIFKDLL
ncbi:MAG: amidohydrolase family protein [Candidatus Bathyarchaeota archaeon]|jgi:predicted TIM-barrel fold metal-dependent hydrolase|nr:amidohydrolase family protein [Candidatus Bathyarchaeota archaeon]